MSEEKRDGGPAFSGLDGEGFFFEGMSLRDWFAGQALQLQNLMECHGSSCENRAKQAYILADALLEERER